MQKALLRSAGKTELLNLSSTSLFYTSGRTGEFLQDKHTSILPASLSWDDSPRPPSRQTLRNGSSTQLRFAHICHLHPQITFGSLSYRPQSFFPIRIVLEELSHNWLLERTSRGHLVQPLLRASRNAACARRGELQLWVAKTWLPPQAFKDGALRTSPASPLTPTTWSKFFPIGICYLR